MANLLSLRAELAELRRVAEVQQAELQRQRRQMELSVRRTADLQGQVDRLQSLVARSEASAYDIKAPAMSRPIRRARAN